MSRTHLLSFPLKSYLLLRHPSARDNRQNLFTGLIRSNLFHSTFNLTLFVCLSREDNARSHACRHFKCSVQRELGATKSIDASRNLDFSSFLPSNSIQLSSALHATCAFSLSLLFYDKVEHPLSAALSLKLLFFAFPRVVVHPAAVLVYHCKKFGLKYLPSHFWMLNLGWQEIFHSWVNFVFTLEGDHDGLIF